MNQKVMLTVDLTRYNPKLIVGAIGVIKDTSRLGDRFLLIKFDNLYIDILCKSLKIIEDSKDSKI